MDTDDLPPELNDDPAQRTIWMRSREVRPTFDSEQGWSAIARQAAIGGHPALPRRSRAVMSRVPVMATVVGLAAVLLIAWGVAWPSGKPSAFREFSTSTGSRSTVTLRDGTQLVLAPESRVRIPSDFGVRERAVELDGEAYFAVVHDARHPFSVHVHNATITDVGTEFDVRHYPTDGDVRIAVARGEVLVGAASLRPAVGPGVAALHPHDVATVDTNGITVTHHADVVALIAWTQGGLAFDNTPLRDALRDVGRTYGLTITCADSTLAVKRITSTFSHESADDVLDAITQAVGARYERTGRTVVIRRAPAHAVGSPDSALPSLRTAQAHTAPLE